MSKWALSPERQTSGREDTLRTLMLILFNDVFIKRQNDGMERMPRTVTNTTVRNGR